MTGDFNQDRPRLTRKIIDLQMYLARHPERMRASAAICAESFKLEFGLACPCHPIVNRQSKILNRKALQHSGQPLTIAAARRRNRRRIQGGTPEEIGQDGADVVADLEQFQS